MESKKYENLYIEILIFTADVIRTSENVMPDPYAFGTGATGTQFDDAQFGQ